MKYSTPGVFEVRMRPWELRFLIELLAHYRQMEESQHIKGFLNYVGQLRLKAALEGSVTKIRFEHDAEQAEAFLRDLLDGIEPEF
jgi:hypothetical protein